MTNVQKKRRVKNTILAIVDVLIVLLVVYFIIGYFNFFKITKSKQPVTSGNVTSYTKNGGEVTVHNYKLYKIIKYQVPDKRISYSMKLWFMEDVK